MLSIKFRFLLVGVTSMLLLNACNADEGNDKTAKTTAAETKAPAAVTVNGKAIPQPVVDMLVKERTAQGPA